MFIYSKFENISFLLNNLLFVTESTDPSFLITLPCILSNKSLPAYNCKENLAHYLAGLIEGDGSFNVPKIIKDSTGKKRVAGIELIGNIKDKPAFELLQNEEIFTLQKVILLGGILKTENQLLM